MPNEYQGTYSVIGPPGTGKTTFIVNQVAKLVDQGVSTLLCSLTRTAAREIVQRRLPIDRKAIGTLHSHAYRSIGAPAVVDVTAFNEFQKLYRLTPQKVDSDEPIRGGTPDDGRLMMYECNRARRLPRDAWQTEIRKFAEVWESFKNCTHSIDYGDMIAKAMKCPPPFNPRVIIADETQDFSRAEMDLLKRWRQHADALIAAGDPWQSLYEWRGADPEAMFMSLDEDHRRVLHQSYRVPRAVHALATRWIKGLSTWRPIEYAPTPQSGEVVGSGGTWQDVAPLLEMVMEHVEAGKTIMFCGSCSYIIGPLISSLRAMGVPYANPWRLTRRDWNPLATTDGKPSTAARIQAFLAPLKRHLFWTGAELLLWGPMVSAKGVFHRGSKGRLPELDETHNELSLDQLRQYLTDEFVAVADKLLAGGQKAMLDWLSGNMVASRAEVAEFPLAVWRRHPEWIDKDPLVYVGTIHSFKGAEADTVVVFPDLSQKWYQAWTGPPAFHDSVVRLFYVAATRAKERLVLCRPENDLYAVHLDQYR